MKNERLEAYPSVEKHEKAWRNLEEHDWSEMRVFGRWTGADRLREIEEMRNESREEVYIDPSVMLDRWGIERCRGSCWGRCRENGRRQLRYRASIEQQGIRSKNRSSIDPPGIEKLSRRCRASFSKQFFERRKTQIWMQSNIQLNQWSNQHNNLSK